MTDDRPGSGNRRRRITVGRVDSVAKVLGLGIGLILGFFVLNLAHMPGGLERQVELDRQMLQRAEAVEVLAPAEQP